MRTEKSFCRICQGLCGVDVTINEQEQIVDIRGDHDHVLTRGYACIKGLQAPHIHHGESRLLHPLKRQADGSFQPIRLEQALDEIADKLQALLAEDEPRSIATYRGTACWLNATASAAQEAFLSALNSPSLFTTATVDQSSKFVSMERLGFWEAGWQPIETCDVWMAFGFNPLVSLQAMFGFPPFNPTKRIQALKKQGVKFILVDPRETETARYADIHLRPYPGEDPTVAAGMLRLILENNWYDAEFCNAHVNGLAQLRDEVAHFTPKYVAERAGIDADDLLRATALFAEQSQRGFVTSCTATSMGRDCNLAVHMLDTLNVVCGRFLREGEPVANPGVFTPDLPRRAQVRSPTRSWEHGPTSRVSDCHGFMGELMSATLADEILTPGAGRIRSLFVVGGNPAVAFPERQKVVKALRALDLLVCIDPVISATAREADYIIPPKVLYERDDILSPRLEVPTFPEPFGQVARAIVKPPEASEVIDDWQVFWELAKRLGLELVIEGKAMPMDEPPSTRDLLTMMTVHAQYSLDEVEQYPAGHVFEREPVYVQPAGDDAGKFDLTPDDVIAEMRDMAGRQIVHGVYEEQGNTFKYLLAVRRDRSVINSMLYEAPVIKKRLPTNNLKMHPDDINRDGLEEGGAVNIESAAGKITATLQGDATLKPGTVTLLHCSGGVPNDQGEEQPCVNDLISSTKYIQSINAMPRFTGVPVNVSCV